MEWQCNLDRLSNMTARSLSLWHTRYYTGTLTDEKRPLGLLSLVQLKDEFAHCNDLHWPWHHYHPFVA